jgi:predicted lipoprotein with Yx(FWY)xxD motif
MKKSMFAAAPVAAALVIAGCGGGSGSSHSKTAAAPSATPAVTLAHAKLGAYIADHSGRALYLFEADKGSASTCYSACASLWPPLTGTSAVTTGSGVARGLLGTTKRKDGTTELTYRGHPLYYYAGDSAAGVTNGQGLDQFGAKWYLVAPSGKKIDNDGH